MKLRHSKILPVFCIVHLSLNIKMFKYVVKPYSLLYVRLNTKEGENDLYLGLENCWIIRQ